MSKRNDYGQFAKAPSKRKLIWAFFGSLFGAALIYLAGLVMWSNFASFKSCGENSNGLVAVDCGKRGLNAGDFIILALSVLAVFMAYSLCIHFYRLMKRVMSK